MFETDSKRCRQLQQLLRFGQDISRTQSRTDSASCRSNCKLSGSHVSPVFSCQINSWHCRFADQEWRWQLSDGIPARQLLSNRPLKEQVTNYEDLRSSIISNNLAHSKSAEIILYNHLTKYAEMITTKVVSIVLFWFCFMPFSYNGVCFLWQTFSSA